jgi:hypothetical protein
MPEEVPSGAAYCAWLVRVLPEPRPQAVGPPDWVQTRVFVVGPAAGREACVAVQTEGDQANPTTPGPWAAAADGRK